MRKFDSGRLYKLLKRLVIIISILSFFMALLSYNAEQEYNKIYNQEYDRCLSEYNATLKSGIEEQFATPAFETCQQYSSDVPFRLASEMKDRISFFIYLGILLPIVFFSGSWVYKYVFPVKEKTKKEE